jgi:hypothetical protein
LQLSKPHFFQRKLSRQQIEAKRSEKANDPLTRSNKKKRVDFSGDSTVTVEGPKETDGDVNKEYWSSYGLTRRPIPSLLQDKPVVVNSNSNPGQFYSSCFDVFNLDDGGANQGPSFFRPAAPSFGAQSQGMSFFSATAPPSYGAVNKKPTEKIESPNSPIVDSSKWSFNHTKKGAG